MRVLSIWSFDPSTKQPPAPEQMQLHITMAPSGIPAPIIVLALWLLVALNYRSAFAPLVRVP